MNPVRIPFPHSNRILTGFNRGRRGLFDPSPSRLQSGPSASPAPLQRSPQRISRIHRQPITALPNLQ
ncbi:hypothetical protein KNP414_06854 [Paenibacillus mucilaginosus KNP414]|uniref:Uncharacterized protein n=1 Tax=Paenibacillus mucilaginosus (strain KNP414) TaxID=1036673 RepID=F8FEQ5_PAEMK|nr:hypothetical protein KNP414_06854 [Paenibacillus mucilaginosus KNP414]